jgi:hypothetical protein
LGWGCGLDSTGSGQGPVAGCCKCGDEPSGSCATELVSSLLILLNYNFTQLLFQNLCVNAVSSTEYCLVLLIRIFSFYLVRNIFTNY